MGDPEEAARRARTDPVYGEPNAPTSGGLPEGGVTIEQRIASGGKVPEYARKNPSAYYYDSAAGKYKSRPTSGPSAVPGKNVADVIQDHHGIPWDNKTWNHQQHPLVKQAGNPSLKKLPENLKPVQGRTVHHTIKKSGVAWTRHSRT
ncbi:hypothetical protein [Gimesia panareensis]|uniref:Uncharacterized protein n=1 Tax=Gimesia panareensis TaxID=2527978 RepID=A0A518FT95_9PLAN|nr:hypothetical protein [Gimesia panareensis]QDU51624.1 hypothetical protein Pan110_39910 [Gimesia panareensis]QDV19562.1 hypothetical protein Pan153_42280 [Gimesia panareensis]